MTSKRPYQSECTASIVDHFYQEGVTCQGVSLPCGAGKTVIVGTLPKDLGMLPGESLLFIAHRHELIDQAASKFRHYNPELQVDIERASERACPDADVVIASMQSMTEKRIKKFDPDRFRIVVLDETQHAASSGEYQRIMEYFGVHRSRATLSRHKLLVGLSATWRRGDSKGYEHIYDKIVFHRSILDIMRTGITVGDVWCPYLAPVRGDRELTETSLDKVHVRTGDLVAGELSQTVNTPQRNTCVVDTYLEKGENLRALGFTADIQHAHDLAKAFTDRGVSAVAVSGNTNRGDRKALFRDYESGLIRVLCSAGVLGEGIDLPWAAVGLNTSPTLSPVVYTQRFGRVGRPWPAPEERLLAFQEGRAIPWVKPYGIWLDFTDSSTKHHPCQAPTLFGLRPDFQFKGKSMEETVKLIEEAKAKNPSLETRELKSLDDLTRSSVAFSSTAAPQEDTMLRKWSSYPWQKESEFQWALPVRGTNTVLRVRQGGDKEFGVWVFQTGAGSQRKVETTLKKAVESAEHLLAAKERKILRRDAPWRREAPTVSQCVSLYMKDAELRKKYRNGDAYFSYAHTQWQNGSMEFSRGSIGDQLNVHFMANRFLGPRSTTRKQNWIQKVAGKVMTPRLKPGACN